MTIMTIIIIMIIKPVVFLEIGNGDQHSGADADADG